MATPVPYSPIPSVQPTDRPTPFRSEAVPAGAFGEGIAAATSHLGQVEENAGTELYGRAVAIQQLNEQAKASEAESNYVTKLGELHADYTSKLGKDAVDGYQPYVDSTNAARASIRDSLDSPFAQRAFDQESRNMQARAIWSASGHMATENKNYLYNASQARIDAASNYSSNNPTDDASFRAGLKKIDEEAPTQATLKGWDAQTSANKVLEQKSKLASDTIQGMVKFGKPFEAQKLLDQYSKEGLLTGQDAARLTDYVTKQVHSVGARNTSAEVLAGNGNSFGAGKVDIDRAAEVVSGGESSGNWIGRHPSPPGKPDQWALGRYGIMNFNLQPWLKEAGMPAMSEAEFIANHDAQTQLFKFKFGQYQEQTGSFNGALHKWFGMGPSDGFTKWDDYLAGANARLARGASGSDLVAAARARAKEQRPDDIEYQDIVADHVEMEHSRALQVQRQDEFANRQTVADAMTPKPDGRLPTSIDDLTQDPKVADAWHAMKSSDQQRYIHELTMNSRQGGYASTPQSDQLFIKMVGIAKDPNRTPEETQEFLDSKIEFLHMPWSQKSSLLTLQKQVMKDATPDPDTTRANKILASMMNDAGITKKAGQTNDDYNQFNGALSSAMEEFTLNNKKKPSDADIKEIGSRLIQQTKYPSSFLFWDKTAQAPLYQVPVPDKDRTTIVNGFRQYGKEPSELEIHNAFMSAQFNKLYSRPTSSKAKRPNE